MSRLYKVLDHYRVQTDGHTCPSAMQWDAQEGRRHVISRISFDPARRKVIYSAQDLVKNTTMQHQLDSPPCTREILTALMKIRELAGEVGKANALTLTDGRKVVSARVEAQAKERVEAAGRQYSTTRYEAFIFDDVLYADDV